MPVAMGLGLMALGYMAFSPLIRKSRTGMDRIFYRHRWEAIQELNQFNSKTENLTDSDKLSRSLIPLVQRAMECSPVVLILPSRHNDSSWSAMEVGNAVDRSFALDGRPLG